jgi:hypothetical protein
VYDSVHGSVYVGIEGLDGYSYAALSAVSPTGSVTTSAGIGDAIEDAPLVDSVAGEVYVTTTSEVFQFPYNFPPGSFGTGAPIGANTGVSTYDGTFDNEYYTSAAPSAPTGNLYVCSISGRDAYLYQIPITAGTMSGSAVKGPRLTDSILYDDVIPTCSPVTEIFSSPIDWVFLSVTKAGAADIAAEGNTCASSSTIGCVYSFDVTSGSISSSTQAANGLATVGGSSGIVIDNTASSPAGASQIYFSTLGNQTCTTSGGAGRCAIQASQAGLQ